MFEPRATAVGEDASADSVTVHWEEPAPVRLFGLQLTPERVVGGVTVITVLTVMPPRAAVRVAEAALVTDPPEAVNCAVVAPCGT